MPTSQLDPDGVWRPAIPLPFYSSRWTWRPPFLVRAFECWTCPSHPKFRTEEAYRDHYRITHITTGDRRAAERRNSVPNPDAASFAAAPGRMMFGWRRS